MQFPALTEVPAEQRAQGSVYVRYEDIAQDGSLKVGGMLPGVGLVAMGKLWFKTKLSQDSRPHGIVPILTRLVLQSTGGPMAVRTPFEAQGAYELAHARDEGGAVVRILLHAQAELYAPVGRTHPPQPANFVERVHVGRVYTEHVFTRPFGPAAERKVVALPTPEGPVVPGASTPLRDALATLALPAGGRWLEPAFVLDAAPLAFGLTHTDSNQHVNSLVYPQLFEDAALRRALELGRKLDTLLVDHIDVSFRKPCFAGQRMYIWMRVFELDGKLGAVGYLGEADSKAARAHCLCALTFRDEQRS
jgi:acyl-CoA thioesterase FadM